MQKQQRNSFQHNMRILVDCAIWGVMSVLTVWALAGVLHAREIKSYVGPNCMHEVRITDFRKPCMVHPQDNNPNMAHCDDVVIHFACVHYK